MKYYYARVSTEKQNLDRQLKAAEERGVDKIYSDKQSGKNVPQKPPTPPPHKRQAHRIPSIRWKLSLTVTMILLNFWKRTRPLRSTLRPLHRR